MRIVYAVVWNTLAKWQVRHVLPSCHEEGSAALIQSKASRPLIAGVHRSCASNCLVISLSSKLELSRTNLGQEKYPSLYVFLEQGSAQLLHRSSQPAGLVQCLLTSWRLVWAIFCLKWMGNEKKPHHIFKIKLVLFYLALGRSNYMDLLKEKS